MLIDYKNVNVYQQDTCILHDVNFQLNKGEFVYFIGKVGSGKTSLLKTFYKEIDIKEGEAEILGYNLKNIKSRQIQELRRKLGIVFQDFQLLTDRSIYENLDFVLKATGWKDKIKRAERIEEVLTLVNMEDKIKKMPAELSGGEQQRVVIARAILNSPELILADEPTGNLDTDTSKQIVELLERICEKGSAVVMTTHNVQILQQYPKKIFKCDNGIFDEIDKKSDSEEEIEDTVEETVSDDSNEINNN